MAVQTHRPLLRHVDTGNSGCTAVTSQTVELAAVRIEAQPATNETWTLVSRQGTGAAGDPTYAIQYLDDAGVKKVRYGFNSLGGTVSVTAVQTLATGRYYAMAGTFDNSTKAIALYLVPRQAAGGSTVGTYSSIASATLGAVTPNTGGTDAATRIGCDYAGATLSNGASASVGEVRVYSAALAKATLDGRLATRLVGNEASLVDYWRLDEAMHDGGGETAYHRVRGTTRTDATLVGRPQWVDDPTDLYYPVGLNTVGLLCWHSVTRRAESTLAASDAHADYPVANLRSPRQADYTRTADVVGTKTWVVDAGRPVAVSALSIRNHNFESGCTIDVQANSADSWGSPAVSEVVTYHPNRVTHLFATTYEYRYWRLVVADSAPEATHFRLGTLDFWHACEIHCGSRLDAEELTLSDPSVTQEIPHGHRVVRSLPKRARWSLSWQSMRRGQALDLRRACELVGAGGYVLVLDNQRLSLPRSVYGELVAPPRLRLAGPKWAETDVDGLTVEEDFA